MAGVAEGAEAVVSAPRVAVHARAAVATRVANTLVHVHAGAAASHRALGTPDTRPSH